MPLKNDIFARCYIIPEQINFDMDKDKSQNISDLTQRPNVN